VPGPTDETERRYWLAKGTGWLVFAWTVTVTVVEIGTYRVVPVGAIAAPTVKE